MEIRIPEGLVTRVVHGRNFVETVVDYYQQKISETVKQHPFTESQLIDLGDTLQWLYRKLMKDISREYQKEVEELNDKKTPLQRQITKLLQNEVFPEHQLEGIHSILMHSHDMKDIASFPLNEHPEFGESKILADHTADEEEEEEEDQTKK